MPYKFHASRRHHIPKAKYRVTNWPDHDRGLVRRGSGLTKAFWLTGTRANDGHLAVNGGLRKWRFPRRCFWGRHSGLPLRQTESLVRSIVDLMGWDLPVPDHTTLSRRRRTVDVALETGTNKRPTDIVLDSTGLKFFGAGESRAKHGETRRSWRKLHILVDPGRQRDPGA